MLATFMLMAIIGLSVFRFYQFFGATYEPFAGAADVGKVSGSATYEPFTEDSEEVTGILQGPAAKTAAAAYPINDQNRIMDDNYAATVYTHLDNHDTLPAFSRSTETPGLYTYTPYDDFKPEEDDARDIPWIASWSRADRRARDGQNCDVKYIRNLEDGITLVTVSKSCEAGMPHTLAGDRIIMSDSIPVADQGPIIEHERIHIYQRRKPEVWAKFYKLAWAFTLHKTPPTNMPTSVREQRRSNPDTFEVPWPCWKERYWPVPVYKDPENPQLRAANTVWWDEQDRETLTQPPPGWSVFFGRPSQDEHPHELAAVMIADKDTASEAGRRIMDWWHSKKQIFIHHKGWM